MITAIDDVYPELRLAERIAADRFAIRRIGPGVREPAHAAFQELLASRIGPGARERTHPPYQERDLLTEIRAFLGKGRK